jgi:hypothetical protein
VLHRPYSLAVVRAADAPPGDHFTLSAAGLTCVRGGGQADFTPLGQWAREALLLRLLCRIAFFRDFVAGRAFRCWHKARARAPRAARARPDRAHSALRACAISCVWLLRVAR